MSNEQLDWIEAIDDEELDPRRLLADIRQEVAQEQVAYHVAGLSYPAHPVHRYPGKPTDLVYDLSLHEFVAMARALEQGSAEGRISSFLARIPVLGEPLRAVYRVISRRLLPILGQRGMNHNLLGAIERLLAENQQQSRQILALRSELDALKREE